MATGKDIDDEGEAEAFSEDDSVSVAGEKPNKRDSAYDDGPQIEDDFGELRGHGRVPKNIKLEKIVEYATWRGLLLDLVATKRLDPWNIDIVEVASSFVERIRKLEMLDLRIPANLILAASILIRFKSDALKFEEEAQVVEDQVYVDEDAEPAVIPILELKTRIPPKRMVTLDELLLAMEKVFDDQKRREEKASRVEIPQAMNIEIPEFDIEKKMEEVFARVLEQKDAEGLTTFSSIIREKNAEEVITTLLPILHLVQDSRLTIFQEEFFGEIFIRVKESGKVKKGEGKNN